MAFLGYLDEANQFALRGWVHSNTFQRTVLYVDIVVNRRYLASVRAGSFREDLLREKIGEGRREFSFNPYESLSSGANAIEVFVSGSDQLIPNGAQIITVDAAQEEERARTFSSGTIRQTYIFSDEIFEHLSRYGAFGRHQSIREIGFDDSRLIAAIRERRYEFQECRGLSQKADVVLCLATSDHRYPSVGGTLTQAYDALNPGGLLFMDFVCADETLDVSRAYFEKEGKAFVRIYSGNELRMFFLGAGFAIVDLAFPVVMGRSQDGQDARRALVVARKPETDI